MGYPSTRLRRLRNSPAIRALVNETRIHPDDFIAPLFIVPGDKIKKEISSLPGQYHLSIDMACEEARLLYDLGISSILLFGVPNEKDETGSIACKEDGIVQKTIRSLKKVVPNCAIVTDLCFCEYTSHGHCGIIKNGELDNDASLEMLVKQALSHANSGCDIIAPSGMLDGFVKTVREGLDENGFQSLPIMSYSAKFASAFYGPFREAAQSTPQFGDRRSYQMNPANILEALREVELDIKEGADIVMVKPALAYLDVIRAVKERFQMPTAAYNVSGEYSMIKFAGKHGIIDEKRAMIESLIAIKRAGSDIIISYFAKEFAELFNKNQIGL